jgi:WD repeat and SOF domain-containing protein 1
MNIKTISRTEEDFVRKTKLDITKVHRNRDPSIHPFERAREYTKAIVSTKVDKMFAKPFVGALDGHTDSVYCMSGVRNKVVPFITGACDGEIKVWDLSRRTTFWSAIAHSGFVRGVAPDPEGNSFFSCGDDKLIKQWNLLPNSSSSSSSSSSASISEGATESLSPASEIEPLRTIRTKESLKGIDHHWVDKQFATCGDTVCLWDSVKTSNDPIHSYKWGADSILSVKFNPAEACLLASTASDRSVCLYDLRASVPMRKFVLAMKSNKVIWNPMEPFNFLLANEDHNIYTFDMRKLDKAIMIHKDHVGAVMDVAFSPTGREFVSGSYDCTVRLFNANSARSKEVYHAKRMQRVFCVNYSADASFVLTGSDDTNIRIWKAQASAQLGVLAGREERKHHVDDKLKKRFAHMPEIQRINRDKKHPSFNQKANSIRHIQATSERRKQDNRKRHSREGEEDILPQRKRVVVKEIE